MDFYMLTWNPEKGRPNDLTSLIEQINNGIPAPYDWSVGNRENLAIGSRVFLVRQGVEPKGIVASGYTTGEPQPSRNNDDYPNSNYCALVFTMVLDPNRGEVLDLSQLRENSVLRNVDWGTQRSGTYFQYEAATELIKFWKAHLLRLDRTELPWRR